MLRRLTALALVTAALAGVSSTTAQARVAHYSGWMCIHRYEGAWYSVGRGIAAGHYNGLQMTWSWGYGIYGNPNNYTPSQILAAAERGYAANHYSSNWLQQQWGQTVWHCWRYFRT